MTRARSLATRISILSVLITLVFAMAAVRDASAQSKQLSLADILIALRSKKAAIEDKNKILTDAVNDRGITFELTAEIEKELDSTGADKALIDAIRVKSPKPLTTNPPVQLASTETKPLGPKPDFAFYKTRALGALSVGDLDGALAEFAKASELKPDDATPHAERGAIYLKQEKYDLAIQEFTLAVQRDAKDTASFFRRALAEEKMNKADDALADYQRAVDADPTNEPAKSAIARINDSRAKALAAAQAVQAAQQQAAPAEKPVDKPAAAAPQVVDVGALNEYATKLVVPTYGAMERRMGIQGKIVVYVKLDAEGNVLEAETKDGPRSLRNAAEDAVKRTKFHAAVIDGHPVPTAGYIVFNFSPR